MLAASWRRYSFWTVSAAPKQRHGPGMDRQTLRDWVYRYSAEGISDPDKYGVVR